jgi:nucleoside-diphosphate-sugar epimerase
MRVLVTGGTGYVGSIPPRPWWRVAMRCALVRDRQRVTAALAPLGLQAADLDTIVGMSRPGRGRAGGAGL